MSLIHARYAAYRRGGDKGCERPIHLGGTGLQLLHGVKHRLEVPCAEKIKRPTPRKFSISSVQPDVDAFRGIDIAKLVHDVMKLQQALL
jgi:hypothetical protein